MATNQEGRHIYFNSVAEGPIRGRVEDHLLAYASQLGGETGTFNERRLKWLLGITGKNYTSLPEAEVDFANNRTGNPVNWPSWNGTF